MPRGFDKCVKRGGKIRTKSLRGNKYVRYCYIDGEEYRGYVQVKKGGKKGHGANLTNQTS